MPRGHRAGDPESSAEQLRPSASCQFLPVRDGLVHLQGRPALRGGRRPLLPECVRGGKLGLRSRADPLGRRRGPARGIPGEPLVSDSLLGHQALQGREGLSMTPQVGPQRHSDQLPLSHRLRRSLSILLCWKEVLLFPQKLGLLVVAGCYRATDRSTVGHGLGQGLSPSVLVCPATPEPQQPPRLLPWCFSPGHRDWPSQWAVFNLLTLRGRQSYEE